MAALGYIFLCRHKTLIRNLFYVLDNWKWHLDHTKVQYRNFYQKGQADLDNWRSG
jgi:hypothetical protein